MSAVEAGLVKAGLVKKGLVTAITLAGRRYFRRNSGGIDYATIPEVTLTGDYIVSVLVYIDEMHDYNTIYDSQVSPDQDEAWIYANGRVGFRPWGGATNADTLVAPSGTVEAHKFYVIEFSRSGSDASIKLDGVTVASSSTAGAVGDVKISYLYGGNNTKFRGIIANLKITDKSQAIENVNTVGPELVEPRGTSELSLNGEFIRTTADNTDTQGAAYRIDGLTIGSKLLVNTTVVRGTSTGHIRARCIDNSTLSGSGYGDYTTGDGSDVAIIDVTASPMYLGTISTDHQAGEYHEFKINSVKEVTSFSKLIRSYAIDDNSDILANGAAVLGVEEVVNGANLVDVSGWSSESADLSVDSGNLVVTSAAPLVQTRAYQSFTTIINQTYKLHFRFIKGTAPSAQQLRIGTSSGGGGNLTLNLSESTTRTVLFVATAATTFVNFGFGIGGIAGVTSIWGDISIRQADGYGQIINPDPDGKDYSLFTEQSRGGDWLGQELVVNGGFDTDSDWALGGGGSGYSISGGKLMIDGVLDGVRMGQTGVSIPTGAIIRSVISADSFELGASRVRFPYTSAEFSGQGVHTFDDVADSSGEFSLQARGITTAIIDNVSARELLKVAT